MSRYISHINTVKKIIALYKGDIPFSHFIKQFFAADKKYGSRDRKHIAHYAYVYFRVAGLLKDLPAEEAILKGLFLCGNDLYEGFPAEWQAHLHDSSEMKMHLLGLQTANVFPFRHLLSPQIDPEAFGSSLLIQPSLFLRMRPGREEAVKLALSQAGIAFNIAGKDALALPSGTDLRTLPGKDMDFVVQDLSSQQVMDDLPLIFSGNGRAEAWDCCAGSGGKSILLWDRLGGKVNITATDVRESILRNYRQRLSAAGIPVSQCRSADIARGNRPDKKFNLVICDAPCSGSGTWGRTPEQMYYFDPASLDEFANRQQSILRNSVSSLLPGGYYLYITCSVFRQENEEISAFISRELGLQLLNEGYKKGYSKKADSMYAALFQLPLTP